MRCARVLTGLSPTWLLAFSGKFAGKGDGFIFATLILFLVKIELPRTHRRFSVDHRSNPLQLWHRGLIIPGTGGFPWFLRFTDGRHTRGEREQSELDGIEDLIAVALGLQPACEQFQVTRALRYRVVISVRNDLERSDARRKMPVEFLST